MARVALINPPLQQVGIITPPLGLAVIANAFVECGHQVALLDLDLEKNRHNHERIEESIACLQSWLLDQEPDIIGCTSMFNNSWFAEMIIKVSRKLVPKSKIIAGGPHFGALAEQALRRNPALDFVVTGEADKAFPDLVEAIENNRPLSDLHNLVMRNLDTEHPDNSPDQSVALQRRADGPLIDLATEKQGNMWQNIADIVPLEPYCETFPAPSGEKYIYIEAGRGCPFSCNFCATAPFWKNKFRVKSVETIVKEMAWLYSEHGFDHFILVHDLLTVRRDFINQLCDAVFDVRLPITWMANSRVDLNHDGLLPKFRSAGCTKLFFGIESGSEEVQNFTTKKLKPATVGPLIGELAEHGITSTCSFVFGFPEESPEELSKTIDLAARTKLHGAETVQFHRLRLWPPAAIVKQASKAVFDEASLRLEWPFPTVEDQAIREIAADSAFFPGYFSLETPCGNQQQLAQMEMFFLSAVATVPLATALLARMLDDQLINVLNDLIDRGLSVSTLAESDPQYSLTGHWRRIEILFAALVRDAKGRNSRYSTLIDPLVQYEIERLAFVEQTSGQIGHDASATRYCSIELAGIDMQHIFDALKNGEEIEDYDPNGTTDILFRRNAAASIETFIRQDNRHLENQE